MDTQTALTILKTEFDNCSAIITANGQKQTALQVAIDQLEGTLTTQLQDAAVKDEQIATLTEQLGTATASVSAALP